MNQIFVLQLNQILKTSNVNLSPTITHKTFYTI